jgi:hypothetical protein
MLNFDAALTALRADVQKLDRLERDRIDLLNLPLPAAMKDERDADLKRSIERQLKLVTDLLRHIVDFPPHHTRHEYLLTQFHSSANFENSVFIMTKFPDPNMSSPTDVQLETIIKTVCGAVQALVH